ncbi:MAG: PadR family transcriptional regulator [Longimicrobiales bacterium]
MSRGDLDLLKGTLDLLVLTALAGDDEQLHGFEVLDRIRAGTDDALIVEEGALYPALHRMQKRGWLAATWGVSEKGRRAKYYRLTPEGRRALTDQRTAWSGYVEAMARLARASGLS